MPNYGMLPFRMLCLPCQPRKPGASGVVEQPTATGAGSLARDPIDPAECKSTHCERHHFEFPFRGEVPRGVFRLMLILEKSGNPPRKSASAC